ncbi:phospholipase [Thalassobacillus sp. CUG 92003]|uniref:phospholipase n=1 Tax=Thalassobacillus sp. CUG 92003 TaxID=2736641 RepID=UPI001C6311A5|nr:phospholipase [Thalassobacillus sp. CUG 92003]
MRRNPYNQRWCVFPGYNWCGPGCSGPGAPINRLDACCQAHDECYRVYGDYCYCDRMMLRAVAPLITPETKEGRHAKKVYDYMRLQSKFTCAFRRPPN